jgi:hypothetical protein
MSQYTARIGPDAWHPASECKLKNKRADDPRGLATFVKALVLIQEFNLMMPADGYRNDDDKSRVR